MVPWKRGRYILKSCNSLTSHCDENTLKLKPCPHVHVYKSVSTWKHKRMLWSTVKSMPNQQVAIIISTVKPCWQIRSLKKFPVGRDNSACSDVTSQISGFAVYMITLQQSFQEFSKMFGFSYPVQRLRVEEWPNRKEKAAFFKITAFVWTGP